MDKKTIKEMLLRRRPWLPRRVDEENVELEKATLDRELKELRSHQGEFNARVHQALVGIPVPPTLRDQILARRKIVSVRTWQSRAPAMLAALAASIAFVASIFFFMNRPQKEDTSFAGFRQRMITDALRAYGMETNTTSLVALKNLLAKRERPTDFSLPPPLQKVPLIGGGPLSWQNKPVSMVCFKWEQKETLYMFVVDESISGFVDDRTKEPKEVKGLSTVAWASGGKLFLLAGKVPENVIKQLASRSGT